MQNNNINIDKTVDKGWKRQNKLELTKTLVYYLQVIWDS